MTTYCDHPTIADYIERHDSYRTRNGRMSSRYAYARAHRRGSWCTLGDGTTVFRHECLKT